MQKTVYTFKRRWIHVLMILISLLSGCSATTKTISDEKFHRSVEYVLYKLKIGDTAASIAQKFLGDRDKGWVIEDNNEHLVSGQFAVVPLIRKNVGGIYFNGIQTVPMLCYHRFGNECDSPLCVSTKLFERQMRYLKTNGYRVITPEQLLAFLEYREAIPKKSVLITIDDGYRSVYDIAYPILKKFHFPATLFIYTNYIGVSSKAITWSQLAELKANDFTIGSHTIMHSDLSKRGENESPGAYHQRLHQEIYDSKNIIDHKLNQDTFFFAYPFGRANLDAMLMTQKAGYKMAVTVNRGGNPFYSNPFLLRRDQVLSKDMQLFQKRLKTFEYLSLR